MHWHKQRARTFPRTDQRNIRARGTDWLQKICETAGETAGLAVTVLTIGLYGPNVRAIALAGWRLILGAGWRLLGKWLA